MKQLVPGLLDRVADRVEPDHLDAVRAERPQDLLEVLDAARMRDVDVDLLGRERRPEYSARAILQRDRRERQARPRPIDRQQVALGSAVREYAVERQEHPREPASSAALGEVQELRRAARYVVHDHVGHHVGLARERGDVVPSAQARVDARVIDRVESGIRAVDSLEERQNVHAAEEARERPGEELAQTRERASEAVRVGDQLDAVLHFAGYGADTGVACGSAVLAACARA